MGYTSTMGDIIKAEDIKKEIPIYYSKKDLDEILGNYMSNVDKTIDTKLNKLLEDMINNGGTISMTNYYTKDQVQDIIKSMKPQTTIHTLNVATDKQTVFSIPNINAPIATFLIFNTTVRTDYTITGSTLTTLFDVPLGSQLSLVVVNLEYTF
jgi:hypothetical protein